MAKVSGKGGFMTFNAVRIEISSWEFDSTADLPDATDSTAAEADVKTHVVGRKEATVNIEGFVDLAALPDVAGKLAVGGEVTTVKLQLDATNEITFAKASISALRVRTPIGTGESISFTATMKVNGTWTGIG